MSTIRNPILRDYRAALVQSRMATGAVSRRAKRQARMDAYRRIFARHSRHVVLRHVRQLKHIFDGVAEEVCAE